MSKGSEPTVKIKSIKDIISSNCEFLEMLKYSHYNPTTEKLNKIIEKYTEDKSIYCFGSFVYSKMIGFIVVKHVDNSRYEIIDIAITPEYRKLGIASKLIDYVIENFNIQILYAETDDDAVDFYKKYGFATNLINKIEETNRYECTWCAN